MVDSQISDYNSFQSLCNAFRDSAIESIRIKNTGFYFQADINALMEVLPEIPNLKTLDLEGQIKLNKMQLINILDHTPIETLALSFVNLSDLEAFQLARKISSTNLKYLDIRDNALNLNTVNDLKNEMGYKTGTKFFFSAPYG